MDSNEILTHQIHELEQKFDYGLIGLTFSSLALSLQFSPKMGVEHPLWLLFSWMALFLSSCLGGWRLMYGPTVRKYNQRVIVLSERAEHGDVFKREAYRKKARDFEGKMHALNRKFPKAMKAQVLLLIFGLLLNGAFAFANYWAEVHRSAGRIS